MRKVITILLCFTVMSAANAQKQAKHFANYYSAGVGLSTYKDITTTIEVGKWGNDKPVCYGVSLDVVKNLDNPGTSYWLGAKPYYQFYSQANYSMYFYFCPKIQLDNTKNYLLEYGFGAYTGTKNKNIYIGYFLGFQSSKDFSSIPAISLSFNWVK